MKTSGNQKSFIFAHGSIGIALDLIDPFGSHNVHTSMVWNKDPYVRVCCKAVNSTSIVDRHSVDFEACVHGVGSIGCMASRALGRAYARFRLTTLDYDLVIIRWLRTVVVGTGWYGWDVLETVVELLGWFAGFSICWLLRLRYWTCSSCWDKWRWDKGTNVVARYEDIKWARG